MPWLDARIPLRFAALDTRAPGEAVLTDGPAPAAPSASFTPAGPAAVAVHQPFCTCCASPGAAASALATLFRQRAVGTGPAFTAVLAAVTPEAEAEVRAALAADVLTAARYRLADPA